MKIIFDNEYEKLEDSSSIRESDSCKYCLFVDDAGFHEFPLTITAHWHEWLEIVHLIEGTMKIITPQGERQVVPGEIVVVGMNTLHEIKGEAGSYRFQCLHVNLGFVIQHISATLLNDQLIFIQNKEEFLEHFTQIIRFMKRNDAISQLKYKANLLELLSICLQETEISKENINTQINDVFSKILFYVSTHYHENISLEVLSRQFGYTPQHVSLMFKKYLDVNYLTYLTKIRLDRARFLLMSTSYKIIDIAYECGFASEHSLINSFKKVYGVTPSQYRKQIKEHKGL